MGQDNLAGYAFDGYFLDLRSRQVVGPEGASLTLTTKAFDTLLYLITRPGEVVGKEELLKAVWPGRVVEDNNLTQAISALRRALGVDGGDRRYILTVSGRGYRFVAPVRKVYLEGGALPGGADADGQAVTEEIAPALPAAGAPGLTLDRLDRPAKTVNQRFSRQRAASALAWTTLGALLLGAFTWMGYRGSTAPLDISVAPLSPEPVPAAQALPAIAVLPFHMLGKADSDSMIEIGLAETLIARLSESHQLHVRAIGSVLRQVEDTRDPANVAEALDAQYVLSGSVQARQDRVRVVAQLFSRSRDAVIWGDTFDAHVDAVFTLQDAIAHAVLQSLSMTLPAGSASHRSPCDGADPMAYRDYLAGQHLMSAPIPDRLTRAIGAFRAALERDPTCARAWAGQAFAWRAMTITGDMAPHDAFPLAEAAVAHALALDPELAEAHAARGFNRFWYDWDWAQAEQATRQAMAAGPSCVDAHFAHAHLMSNLGRTAEALQAMEIVRQLDPLSPLINAIHGQILAAAGEEEAAAHQIDITLRLAPDFWIGLLMRGSLALQQGDTQGAIVDLENAAERSQRASLVLATLGMAYARNGQPERAQTLLDELELRSNHGYVPPTSLAAIHLALGRTEQALQLLEDAYQARDLRMTFLRVDMRWNPIRREPRFIALGQQMGLTQTEPATGL